MENSLILIVDDDTDDREIFCDIMGQIRSDVTVLEAKDGEHGLQTLLHSTKNPSAIFLDLNMPRINGLELLTILKAMNRFKEVPVIMYSTSSSEREIRNSMDLGASGFIVKDADLTVMAKLISDALQGVFSLPRTASTAASVPEKTK